jgi:predicted Mrr-cat superfamily restriction endonuclease
MSLFGVKLEGTRSGLIKSFLEDNYICAGEPGIGDLENSGREDIRSRLAASGAYQGQELENLLESLFAFVHVMQDGDYVLIADEEWVYLGDVGDYFYDARHDSIEGGTSQRRGVTWLKSLPRTGVNSAVQDLLAADSEVTQYAGVLPAARMDLWLADSSAGGGDTGHSPARVDEGTIAEALAVLKAALHSPDAERRERAAAAILHYAK